MDLNKSFDIFIDKSVNTNDISDSLTPQTIRRKIRDEYLKDSTVTILLVGTETQYRKHIDWELKSSMIDGQINKKSGILVITLPSLNCTSWITAHAGEKEKIYREFHNWREIETKSAEAQNFSAMPERIIDNIVNPNANISIVPWDRIENNPKNLAWLIEATANSRRTNAYDLILPMQMRDYNRPFASFI